MARPWYKRDGAAFIQGTMGLTLEEKGAYSLCLDLIYSNGGPIADDARWLSGVCGVSLRKWNALRNILIERGKLFSDGGRLMNARAATEIASLEREIPSETSVKPSPNPGETQVKPQRKVDENGITLNGNKDLLGGDKTRERLEEKQEGSAAVAAPAPGNISPKLDLIPSPGPAPRPKPEKSQGTRWAPDARVPDDWPEDAVAACRDAGLQPPDLRREAGKFERYWASKPGAAGRKVDWKKTFINWIIKAAEDAANRNQAGRKDSFASAISGAVQTRNRGRLFDSGSRKDGFLALGGPSPGYGEEEEGPGRGIDAA